MQQRLQTYSNEGAMVKLCRTENAKFLALETNFDLSSHQESLRKKLAYRSKETGGRWMQGHKWQFLHLFLCSNPALSFS